MKKNNKKNKKVAVANKAAVVRKARTEFRKAYGDHVFNSVWNILTGGRRGYLLTRSASAIKAHITRGTYDQFLVNCNFV